jgi:cell wall-associated NlpC family hydrolase
MPGDLILFTGTDSSDRRVGHMGIIVSNENDSLRFIHSSSGKANGVTITPLNEYYKGRFMKVIRVFRQNESK